jgi:hypothetical protein
MSCWKEVTEVNNDEYTVGYVLKKIEDSEPDTEHSKVIFKSEEGLEDDNLKSGRRDWIILSEIYGDRYETKSQLFHLRNYLQFKLHDGLEETDNFKKKCYRYIRNAALILYIREVVFGEKKEDLQPLVKEIEEYYINGGKINTAYKIAKKSISN